MMRVIKIMRDDMLLRIVESTPESDGRESEQPPH